jgi:hypothetical protein
VGQPNPGNQQQGWMGQIGSHNGAGTEHRQQQQQQEVMDNKKLSR